MSQKKDYQPSTVQGTVGRLLSDYGFIEVDGEGDDTFFHFENVMDKQELVLGQLVTVTRVKGKKGWKAVKVVKLELMASQQVVEKKSGFWAWLTRR